MQYKNDDKWNNHYLYEPKHMVIKYDKVWLNRLSYEHKVFVDLQRNSNPQNPQTRKTMNERGG